MNHPYPPMFHLPEGHLMITGGQFAQYNGAGFGAKASLHEFFKDHIASDASYDSNDKIDPPKCHPGTRASILQQLEDWAKECNSPSVLWLFGTAGAGKTAIARTLAEILAKMKHLAASFFFYKSAPKRNHERFFVPTLAYQLAINAPEIRVYILKAVEEDPSVFQKSLETQFQRLILDPITQLSSTSIEPSRGLFIIDGLDECLDRSSQCRIIETICHGASSLNGCFKFLVVSRPEYHIETTFNRPAVNELTRRIDLVRDFSAYDDLRLFITERFQRIKEEHPLKCTIDESWPSDGILDQLVHKAAISNFLYARVVMDFIETTYDRPQDRLEVILGLLPASSHGENPYRELDELYRYILSSVRAPIDSIIRPLAIAIVGATLRESITYDTISISMTLQATPFLEAILDFKPHTMKVWLIDLRSLISVKEHRLEGARGGLPAIEIMHTSFTEFLSNSLRSKEYSVDYTRACVDIASGCLRRAWDSENNDSHDSHWLKSALFLQTLGWVCNHTPQNQLDAILMDMDMFPAAEQLFRSFTSAGQVTDNIWANVHYFFSQCLTGLTQRATASIRQQVYTHHVKRFHKWLKFLFDKSSPQMQDAVALAFIFIVHDITELTQDLFVTHGDWNLSVDASDSSFVGFFRFVVRNGIRLNIRHKARELYPLWVMFEESLWDHIKSGESYSSQEIIVRLVVRLLSDTCIIESAMSRTRTRYTRLEDNEKLVSVIERLLDNLFEFPGLSDGIGGPLQGLHGCGHGASSLGLCPVRSDGVIIAPARCLIQDNGTAVLQPLSDFFRENCVRACGCGIRATTSSLPLKVAQVCLAATSTTDTQEDCNEIHEDGRFCRVTLDFDQDALRNEKRTVHNIDIQLRWHRELREEGLGYLVPKKKDLRRKMDKLEALIEAVERYKSKGFIPPKLVCGVCYSAHLSQKSGSSSQAT